MSKFYSGFGHFGSGACAVIVGVQPVQHVDYWLEMQKHVEYVSCKSRVFAGAVASMRWHPCANRKQANIESSHLIVTCTKVAARYDTGSNQQPNSAQSTADGRLRAVKFPGNPRQEHFSGRLKLLAAGLETVGEHNLVFDHWPCLLALLTRSYTFGRC